MKYAISCTSDAIDSPLSDVFARCDYFAIWNSETDGLTFVANPFSVREEHVGKEVLNFLVDLEIQRIIATSFGTKVQNMVEGLNLQLIVFDRGDNKLTDALELLRRSMHP